jgi:hypothetical protein
MTKTLFILTFLLSLNIWGQNKIKIDKSLTPDKIVCNDTSFWFDNRDTTWQTLIPYPNNSKVTFNDNFKFGEDITNCIVKLGHDSIFIHLFKITYGLRVYLDITCINDRFSAKFIHDRSNVNVIRTFKVDRCELILNQEEFKKGQTLVGKLNLSFSGSTLDMESNKDKKVSGQLSGLFKSEID